ncbi:MAG: DUF1343 domain-containing protein [Ruminococcaceae bacterium]|nr:DUF1343 domain-containing protein [Oscillospiraceae bacterium]
MVKTGIDMVKLGAADSLLTGRLGLLTNHSGVDAGLTSTIDILHERFNLTALFAPEHGVRGAEQAGFTGSERIDPRSGAPIYSLYSGSGSGMTQEMLDSFDTFVYDIQDVGARLYTYPGQLKKAMRELAGLGKRIVILDRPNPLGCGVDGKVREDGLDALSSFHNIPARYGLTIGELARMFNEEENLGCDLHVVPMEGYRREMYYRDTGLHYVNPSPNLPTLDGVALYIGTCLIEGTTLSEGRGTTRPFEVIGAPWIDPERTAEVMNALELPGVRFRAARFVPVFSKHQGVSCGGVQIHVSDERAVRAFETGVRLLMELKKQTIEAGETFWQPGGPAHLAGTREIIADGLENRLDDFFARCEEENLAYLPRAERFRIYD